VKKPLLIVFALFFFVSLACEIPVVLGRIETPSPAAATYYIIPAVSATAFQPGNPLESHPVLPSQTNTATGTISVTSTLLFTPTTTGTATSAPTGSVTPLTPTSSATLKGTSTITMTEALTYTSTRTATFWSSATVTNTRTVTRTSALTIQTNTRTITRTASSTSTSLPPAATSTSSATPNQTLVQPTAPVSPMDLINAMNVLRVANGFPPLAVNQILMGTAQWTAEYMAANHLLGHIGNVRGRVAEAGYGSGATVYATEIGRWGSPRWRKSWRLGRTRLTCTRRPCHIM